MNEIIQNMKNQTSDFPFSFFAYVKFNGDSFKITDLHMKNNSKLSMIFYL